MVQTFYPPVGSYLALCPFCGNKPNLKVSTPWFRNEIYKIECSLANCGISVQSDVSMIEAYAKWNRRAPFTKTPEPYPEARLFGKYNSK